MFLQERANARARGDRGVERCMNVELARMGYREEPEATESTIAPQAPERAVPAPARKGRRPKPRCEHGMLIDRCPECNEDVAA